MGVHSLEYSQSSVVDWVESSSIIEKRWSKYIRRVSAVWHLGETELEFVGCAHVCCMCWVCWMSVLDEPIDKIAS